MRKRGARRPSNNAILSSSPGRRRRRAPVSAPSSSRRWATSGVGMTRIPWYRNICWPIASFIIGAHIVAAVGTYFYATRHGFTLSAIIIGVVFLFLTTFGISGGYHRLFAHGT